MRAVDCALGSTARPSRDDLTSMRRIDELHLELPFSLAAMIRTQQGRSRSIASGARLDARDGRRGAGPPRHGSRARPVPLSAARPAMPSQPRVGGRLTYIPRRAASSYPVAIIGLGQSRVLARRCRHHRRRLLPGSGEACFGREAAISTPTRARITAPSRHSSCGSPFHDGRRFMTTSSSNGSGAHQYEEVHLSLATAARRAPIRWWMTFYNSTPTHMTTDAMRLAHRQITGS